MERWEYKLGEILPRGISSKEADEEWDRQVEEGMNKMGAEGWELVGERERGAGVGQMVYKRKLESFAKRALTSSLLHEMEGG